MPHPHPPGDDTAVLLLHGLYSNPNEMSPLGKELEKAGYRVAIPHLQGYTVCAEDVLDRRFARSPWEDWYAQVETVFDELRQQHRRVVVGGLCIGADLALHLAAQRGLQVAAVLALATTLYYDGWGIPWYSFLLPLGYHTPLRHIYTYRERAPFGLKNPRVRARVERDMREREVSAAGASELPLNGIYQAQRLIGSIKKELPQVVSPTLVIHSREDDVASLRSPEQVYRRISAERRRKVVLDDSYHIITLDNERRRVSSEALDFLAQVLGAPAAARLPRAA